MLVNRFSSIFYDSLKLQTTHMFTDKHSNKPIVVSPLLSYKMGKSQNNYTELKSQNKKRKKSIYYIMSFIENSGKCKLLYGERKQTTGKTRVVTSGQRERLTRAPGNC